MSAPTPPDEPPPPLPSRLSEPQWLLLDVAAAAAARGAASLELKVFHLDIGRPPQGHGRRS